MTDTLLWGIKNGELEQVRDLVDAGRIDLNQEINGRCPLHYAADYGQAEVLSYLIAKGANVNALDKHGISALLAAIWEGHVECVKILLKNGASKDGLTPEGVPYIDATDNAEIKSLLK